MKKTGVLKWLAMIILVILADLMIFSPEMLGYSVFSADEFSRICAICAIVISVLLLTWGSWILLSDDDQPDSASIENLQSVQEIGASLKTLKSSNPTVRKLRKRLKQDLLLFKERKESVNDQIARVFGQQTLTALNYQHSLEGAQQSVLSLSRCVLAKLHFLCQISKRTNHKPSDSEIQAVRQIKKDFKEIESTIELLNSLQLGLHELSDRKLSQDSQKIDQQLEQQIERLQNYQ